MIKEYKTMVVNVKDPEEKKAIARTVLEGLKEWFEVDESREGYIHDCVDWIFLAAKDGDKPMGFLCLKETGNATVELAVMGVLKDYHKGSEDLLSEDCLPSHENLQDEDGIIEDINGEWLRLHLTNVIMENMGERDGGIIIDYYLEDDTDTNKLAEKYGVSRERVRQIIRNLSKYCKKAENLKSIRKF